jgi:aminoglycoside phosphotransferase (APT) family kinase protein
MPISLTPDQAAAELRARGHDALDVVALSGGLWSAAYAFRENRRDYVVRFHERRDDLEKDRFAERWAAPGLRIPHMVEIGDMPVGAYGISERVLGRPIDEFDEARMREILPKLFGTLDRLRRADVSATRGYGLWHGDGNAPHPSWRESLLDNALVERARARLRGTPVGTDGFDAAIPTMRDLLGYASEERHVVHNDLLNYNVLVDPEGVVLLDWGASIYGDFLYDWALLRFWWPWYRARWGGIDMDEEVTEHFRAAGVPHVAERLRLCELHIGVDHIEFQAGRAEWDNARWTAARTVALSKI